MKKFALEFLSISILAIAFLPVGAHAEDETPDPNETTITLDGQVHKPRQLLLAFLDAVFTKDVVNERSDWGRMSLALPNAITSKYFSREFQKAKYPWLYPHIYPENGLPRLLSVNKWVKPIRISTGLPNDLRTFGPLAEDNEREFAVLQLYPYEMRNRPSFEQDTTFPEVKDEIVSLATELSGLTGLRIDYVAHEDETHTDYANVRLVFVDKEHFIDSEFRNPAEPIILGVGQFMPTNFRSFVKSRVFTGFVYAAAAQKQVDGFFLTNERNEIDFAACFIWRGHSTAMKHALVQECLVRSLGLPGVISGDASLVPQSALTLWNEPETWPKPQQANAKAPTALSEFDERLIRTLYDPAIKPGMDYVTMQQILSKKD